MLEQATATALLALEDITEAVEILAAHPLIGRRVEAEIRELVISRGQTGYLALYCFDVVSDAIRILRIRHQREAGYRD